MRGAGKILFTLMMVMTFCSEPVWADFNTNGEKGAVRTISAGTMGTARLHIGTGISIFQSGAFVADIYDPSGQPITGNDVNRDQSRMLSSNMFLGAGITDFLDMGMALPFYYDWLGFDNLSDDGIGDLEISAKFLFPPLSKRLFYQAYYLATTVPVGMRTNGFFPRSPSYIEGSDTNPASMFYSSGYLTVKAMLLWTFNIGAVASRVPLQVHLNLGGAMTSSIGHERNMAITSLALEYTPSEVISLFVDFHSEVRWTTLSATLDPTRDPLVLSPGIRLTTASGLYLSLIGDISLSSNAESARLHWHPAEGSAQGYRYSTGIIPDYGIQFIIGWSGYVKEPDDDMDGITNNQDKCPRNKEDFDGFREDDGCPDYDNDNDGIRDSLDKCPDSAEDRDGFRDSDGCPDYDNDNDGIPDVKDQCPDTPEDFDGSQDQDGCPDYDNDRDGIPDSLDKCRNDPEDVDGFQDGDGCPDADNDADGVPDSIDKCPNVFGLPGNKGCPPDTVRLPVQKAADFPKSQVLFGVSFRKSTAEMTFESYQFLEPIIQKLKASPEVEIEIHGHTEGMGDYMKNMQLSQMRAEAVRQYIVTKGITANRIRSVGFGSSSPIADNKTAAGRAQNRRIEIIRVK